MASVRRGGGVDCTAPTLPDAFYQWGDTTRVTPNSQNLVPASHLNVSQQLSHVCAVPIGTLSNCACVGGGTPQAKWLPSRADVELRPSRRLIRTRQHDR